MSTRFSCSSETMEPEIRSRVLGDLLEPLLPCRTPFIKEKTGISLQTLRTRLHYVCLSMQSSFPAPVCQGSTLITLWSPRLASTSRCYATDTCTDLMFAAEESWLRSPKCLRRCKKIKQDAESRPPPEVSIPTFTGADRTSWWQARSSLECLPANRETFEMVDSAIGVLSLASDLCNDWDSLARALLHGNGRSIWFDKPLSIIVTADGEAGVNFEHTPADGHTVLRFVREAAQFLRGSGVDPGPDANAGQPQVLRSDFRMPDDKAADLRSLHRRCLGAIRDNMSTLRLTSLLFKEFGREDIKKAGFAPDGFTQMAFQLSYHRLYGTWVSCYESCMTKQFLHGRTEAIRSTSTEAQDFVAAMLSGSSTKGSKRAALERAIKAHSQQAALCRNGLGVDRHLYGLGKIATESGLPIPALLQSPAYKALSSSVLSTSNVSDTSLSLFGFGPVAPNGFGIGYVQHADSMRFCVSSFGRWTEGLVEDLNLALREMIML
eukprot:Rmarinus@m.24930